jgi:hypothetical protein
VADELEENAARTPAVVAEVLRRAPQDATDDERALVWGFLRDASQWSAEGEALWLLGADEALSWLRGATQSGDEVETGFVELVQSTRIPAALRDLPVDEFAPAEIKKAVTLKGVGVTKGAKAAIEAAGGRIEA